MIIFYIVSIMVMRVLQSVFSKRSYLELPDGLMPYIKYITISQYMAAAFALISVITSRDFGNFNAQAFIIAAVSGLFLTCSTFCSIKAMSGGTIVLNSLFGTAGMLLPCILGIFVFNEPMSFMQCICIGVLFISIWLLAQASSSIFGGIKFSTVFYLIGSLFSNGMVMFCQKLFGFLQSDGNISLFSCFTFLIPAVGLSAFLFFNKTVHGDDNSNNFSKNMYIYMAILAFAVFVIQQFVTLLSPHISSVVLFSIVNGGATVIAAIVGAIFYHEEITPRSVLGVMLGILSLIAIKIF